MESHVRAAVEVVVHEPSPCRPLQAPAGPRTRDDTRRDMTDVMGLFWKQFITEEERKVNLWKRKK